MKPNHQKIYKWLYEKGGFYRNVYMDITFIRQTFYIFTGRKEIARKMIYEHFEWK
jgi:hypothetical protein